MNLNDLTKEELIERVKILSENLLEALDETDKIRGEKRLNNKICAENTKLEKRLSGLHVQLTKKTKQYCQLQRENESLANDLEISRGETRACERINKRLDDHILGNNGLLRKHNLKNTVRK